MKKIFYRSDVWDLGQIELLYWGYFSFSLVALVGEFFWGLSALYAMFWFVALTIFFRFFFHVRQNLQYSYWTLAGIFLIYLVLSFNSLVRQEHSFFMPLCYLLAITFLCLDMYFLFSPIYYPLIRWWEYDFRFRDDLKVKVSVEGQESEGRLTDLRRGASCVALFSKHAHGVLLNIELEGFTGMGSIKAEIVSRRQYSLGRPYTYGVRLLLDSPKAKQSYVNLVRYWKSRKRLLKKLKYISESS